MMCCPGANLVCCYLREPLIIYLPSIDMTRIPRTRQAGKFYERKKKPIPKLIMSTEAIPLDRVSSIWRNIVAIGADSVFPRRWGLVGLFAQPEDDERTRIGIERKSVWERWTTPRNFWTWKSASLLKSGSGSHIRLSPRSNELMGNWTEDRSSLKHPILSSLSVFRT